MHTSLSRTLFLLLGVAACGDNFKGTVTPDGSTDNPSTISLGTPTVPAGESGDITVTVERTGDLALPASVRVETVAGSATTDVDYGARSELLAWEAGDGAAKTITIPIRADLAIEGAEGFEVQLTEPMNANIGVATASVEITDDDRVGDTFVVTSQNRLVTFDRATPGTPTSAVAITGLTGDILGGDVRPANGMLYLLTSDGKLWTVDGTTGVATLAGTLAADANDTTSPFTALDGTAFGVDFNPVPDRLRIVSNTGQNLRVNVDVDGSSEAITDGAINGAITGAVAVGYTNAFAKTCRTQLFAIDAATDRLLLQNPPNDGTTTAIGNLNLDATTVHGFDVATDAAGANTALAVLDVGGATGMYQIDLATGIATSVGAFALDNGELVRALVLPTLAPDANVAQAAGELYAATATNQLVSFNRGAPGKACSSVAITGLAASDAIAGIDFRPSTGALHALTNDNGTGKLYTIDRTTGAAANPVTLSTPLVGTTFGMDFNPTGPVALRIVSDTGQNLRVTDVATGATTADGALNGAGTGATAAGYTDSVQGAGTTTLYVLDTAADRLRIQSPPNAGTLVDVGAFGVDVEGAAFDVDGRDNVAFIAANAATGSTLHTLNLATGAVSASLGAITGGARIAGLARPTPTTTLFGLRTGNVLVRLSLADLANPTTVGPVTGLNGEDLVGIDVRPSTGVLHGIGSNGGVFAIDPMTAAATRLVPLVADAADMTAPFTALAGTSFGLDFNPTGPVALRLVSDAEQNLRIPNVLTGATFTDTALVRAQRTYAIGAVAYTNNVPAASATTLYALDATTDKLVSIATPNSGVVRELGALGFDVDTRTTFEIVAADTAIAVAHPNNTPTFYSIDLATGRATAIGAVGSASPIIGIAAPVSATTPAANSDVLAVTAAGALVKWTRDVPGTVTTIATITGIGATESIVAIDVRPSTGDLWLLTRDVSQTARLYTVDTATAVATARSTLAADANDLTSPYAALLGTNVAMDFNPTGPVALRIVTDAGLNLRIVDPTQAIAATVTDTAIGLPAPDIVAAAYTNSYPGSTATQLFVIDAASASLQLQAPPNDGVLTPVGALAPGLAFASTAAFDIAGGNNGIALAVLQVASESSSRLYRVNLATGAATEVGTGIGAALVGFAIQVR